jgi:hypothetical protein
MHGSVSIEGIGGPAAQSKGERIRLALALRCGPADETDTLPAAGSGATAFSKHI